MTVEFAIEADGLPLSVGGVLRAWRCRPERVAGSLRAEVEATLSRAWSHMDVRAGYRHLDGGEIEFETGRIIAEQLAGSTSFVLFLVSLGPAYDDWSRALFAEDPLAGYAADTIGSLAVEAAADLLEARVEAELLEKGLHATNRYSPGYCGWDVAGQETLFAALPEGCCGVRLTPSHMMVPLKSVSGVIGAGRGVEKRPYPCRTCENRDCLRRRRGV